MKRSKLPALVILATIVALLAAAVPVSAQAGPPPGSPDEFLDEPPGPPSGPPERFFAEHAERLGLDQAALDRIRAIVDASRAEGSALRDRMRDERGAMRDLLSQDNPDEAAVMHQADAVGAAMTALKKHHLATMLKIRALLTPEQRAELEKLRQEMGPRMHHGGPFGKGRR
jgi:Spy/CpxP family protein refolding chaperone